jgi:hypothetical protein
MDTICLRVQMLETGAHSIATIWINGRDLIDWVREVEAPFASRDGHPDQAGQYVGLPAAEIFLPSRHLLGEPCRRHGWGSGKIPVLGCECGESGCWPLLVCITVGQGTVTWSEFEQPHRREGSRSHWRYDQLGPFVFDRQQYETALVEPRPSR